MTHKFVFESQSSKQFLIMDEEIHGAVAVIHVSKNSGNVFSICFTEQLYGVAEQAINYCNSIDWRKE